MTEFLRSPEEVKRLERITIATRAFREPMGEVVQSHLPPRNESTDPTSPVGVVSERIFKLEFELQGLKSEDQRKATREIASSFLRPTRDFRQALALPNRVDVRSLSVGDLDNPTHLYYRSDIPRNEVKAREETYVTVLEEQAQALREAKVAKQQARAKKGKEKPRSKEILPPPLKVTLNDIPDAEVPSQLEKGQVVIDFRRKNTQERDPLLPRKNELRATSWEERGLPTKHDILLLHPDELNTANAERAKLKLPLLPSSIHSLFEKGIDQKLLPNLIDVVRNTLIHQADETQERAIARLAPFFSDNRKPRELLLFTPFASMLAVGNTPEIFNGGVPEYTYPRRDNDEYKDDSTVQATYKRPPISVALTFDWHTRFATSMYEGYKNTPALTNSPSPEVQTFLKVLDDENFSLHMHALLKTGQTEYNGITVNRSTIDQAIASHVLPDKLVLHAIGQQVLLYHLGDPVVPAKGKGSGLAQEAIDNFMGLVCSHFSPLEYAEFLRPVSVTQPVSLELELQIGELKHRAAQPGPNQKKDQENLQKLQALAAIKAKNSRSDSVGTRFEDALRHIVPQSFPNPKEYVGGEKSIAYKKALASFKERQKKASDLVGPPLPEDYTEGSNSVMFIKDRNMFNTFGKIRRQVGTPE